MTKSRPALPCLLVALTSWIPATHAQPQLELDPTLTVAVRSRYDVSLGDVEETSDGKLYLAGNFHYADGLPYDSFARFEPTGVADGDFVPSPGRFISRLAGIPDGKILVLGQLDIAGTRIPTLWKMNEDGSVDETFAAVDLSSFAIATDVKALPDGGCYLITNSPPPGTPRLYRLLPAGQVAPGYPRELPLGSTSFNSVGPNGEFAFMRPNFAGPAALLVWDINGTPLPLHLAIPSNFRPSGVAYEPAGSIVLSGQTIPGIGPGLIRILPSGQRDLAFIGSAAFPNQYGGGNLVRLSDGSFVTANLANPPASQPHLGHYSSNGVPQGTVFLSATPEATLTAAQVFPLSSGDYIASGRFLGANGAVMPMVARIRPDALPRDSFFVDLLARGTVMTSALAGDSYLFGGRFSEVAGVDVGNAALLDPQDNWRGLPLYTPNQVQRARSSLDGGAFVHGSFGTLPGIASPGLFRLRADDSIDTSFMSNFPMPTEAAVQQPDGTSIVVGRFGLGAPVGTPSLMARISADGTLDPTFFTGSTIVGQFAGLTAVDRQDSGHLIVAGQFSAFQGLSRPGIARTDSNGIVDASWAPTVGLAIANNSIPRQLQVQPDGSFYVIGTRNDAALGSSPKLHRFLADGSIDVTFAPDLGTRNVTAYVISPDDWIYVAGGPTATGGMPGVMRLNSSGELDPTFTCSTNLAVTTLALDSVGRLLVGGAFTQVNGEVREGVARFAPVKFAVSIDGATDVTVRLLSMRTFSAEVVGARGPVTYQWLRDGEPIPGATSDTFTLSHIVPKHEGVYAVEATSADQTVVSEPVRLSVSRAKPAK